jgi:hypothetical protein
MPTVDLKRVTRAAHKAAHARDAFHVAIRAASAAGESTRSIAQVAGLSHQRIHQILHGR